NARTARSTAGYEIRRNRVRPLRRRRARPVLRASRVCREYRRKRRSRELRNQACFPTSLRPGGRFHRTCCVVSLRVRKTMPRSLDVARRTAALVLAGSVVFGCATPSRPKPAKPTTAPIPAPVPPPPTATPLPPVAPATPAPPLSIGPRPETVERPERELGPAPPALPTAPPVAPGQRGKFVVLNFDNADIETVIHAASEIVGFNYVLSNDVRGKVTVQTSGRVAQEDVFGVLLAILEVNGSTAVNSGTLYKIVRIEGARE